MKPNELILIEFLLEETQHKVTAATPPAHFLSSATTMPLSATMTPLLVSATASQLLASVTASVSVKGKRKHLSSPATFSLPTVESSGQAQALTTGLKTHLPLNVATTLPAVRTLSAVPNDLAVAIGLAVIDDRRKGLPQRVRVLREANVENP